MKPERIDREPIHIREAERGDSDTVLELVRDEEIQNYVNAGFIPQGKVNALLELHGGRSRTTRSSQNEFAFRSTHLPRYVAMKGGRVVGYIEAFTLADVNLVQSLVVAKSEHGTGLASELFNTVLKRLNADAPIQLMVAKHNQRAISFYKKIGFRFSTDPLDANRLLDIGLNVRIPVFLMIRPPENEK
jgi:ribosomal protein S18 acetylase RimI-like enzyme